MFQTLKHTRALLSWEIVGKSGGGIVMCAANDDEKETRLIFPHIRVTGEAGMELLGESPSGKNRFRGERIRNDRTIDFSVYGKPKEAAVAEFTDRVVTYAALSPADFTFHSWTKYGSDASQYMSTYTTWRIGTKDVMVGKIFPNTERIRGICAAITTPNVLIKRSRLSSVADKPENYTNHVMLEFAEPQTALDIDKICYLIAGECEPFQAAD